MPVTALRSRTPVSTPNIGTLGSAQTTTFATIDLTTVTSTVFVGDTIYAICTWLPGATTDTCTFSDSNGNTWVTDVQRVETATLSYAFAIGRARCTVSKPIGSTITGTPVSTGTAANVTLSAFKDASTSRGDTDIVDGSITGTSTTTTTPTPGTVTPTFDRDFVVHVCLSLGPVTGTPSTGMTEMFDFQIGSRGVQINVGTLYTSSLAGIAPFETLSGAPTKSMSGTIAYKVTRPPAPVTIARSSPRSPTSRRGRVRYVRGGFASGTNATQSLAAISAALAVLTNQPQAHVTATPSPGLATLGPRKPATSITATPSPGLASITKQPRHIIPAATSGSVASVIAQRIAVLALSAISGSVASMPLRQLFNRTLTANSPAVVSITKRPGHVVTAASASSATVAAVRTTLLTITATVGSVVSIVKQPRHAVTAASSSVASMPLRQLFNRTLTVASPAIVAITKRAPTHAITATAPATATVSTARTALLSLVATVGSLASLTAFKIASGPIAVYQVLTRSGGPSSASTAGGTPGEATSGGTPGEYSSGGPANPSTRGGTPTIFTGGEG